MCIRDSLLLELLFVKFGYFSVSCLSQADITCAVDSICIFLDVWCFYGLCHICTSCTIFIMNNNNCKPMPRRALCADRSESRETAIIKSARTPEGEVKATIWLIAVSSFDCRPQKHRRLPSKPYWLRRRRVRDHFWTGPTCSGDPENAIPTALRTPDSVRRVG